MILGPALLGLQASSREALLSQKVLTLTPGAGCPMETSALEAWLGADSFDTYYWSWLSYRN